MSILNRPTDGIYSVLIVIYKFLLVHKQFLRKDLLRLCAPESLPSQDMFTNTLNRWIELGLFQENENNIIEIAPKFNKKRINDVQKELSELPIILREIVLKEENNNKFWDNKENKSADFTRALSWLLAQDVYTFPSQNFNFIERMESRQFSNAREYRLFQNDTRWNGFKAWATYLGFGWNSGVFQIDPTKAIRDSLPKVFDSKNYLTLKKFLSNLQINIPVIDNGIYRKKVERELLTNRWRKNKDNELSTSLSIALLRLNVAGIITFEYLSDTPGAGMKLMGKNNKELREVTNIKLN